MKNIELIKMLQAYPDDTEILVECHAGGFDEPRSYVLGVRPRRAEEMAGGTSEYVAADGGAMRHAALVLGSGVGLFS